MTQHTVGTRAMSCPECGGELELERNGRVAIPVIQQWTGDIVDRVIIASFVACGACEFCEVWSEFVARQREGRRR